MHAQAKLTSNRKVGQGFSGRVVSVCLGERGKHLQTKLTPRAAGWHKKCHRLENSEMPYLMDVTLKWDGFNGLLGISYLGARGYWAPIRYDANNYIITRTSDSFLKRLIHNLGSCSQFGVSFTMLSLVMEWRIEAGCSSSLLTHLSHSTPVSLRLSLTKEYPERPWS